MSNIESSNSSTFKVPPGFKLKTQKSTPKGKEFWLIQVPPKFDVKSLEKLPLESETFTHGKKNKSYTIRENDDQGQKTIHLGKPIKDSQGEKVKITSKLKISKSFTINQMAHVPNIDYDAVKTPKPLPVQPEGMTVKHWATGYGPGHDDGVSSKKRHNDAESEADSPKKSKKSKKEKKDKKDKKLK